MRTRVLSQKNTADFESHKFNIHSQCGEDGLIEYIQNKIGVKEGYFVEFGAWDGQHLSNCAYLVDKNWKGCFIEGDVNRFKDLLARYRGNERIVAVNKFVSVTGENSLDSILTSIDAPRSIDVLSIDIDGYDYMVWDSLKEFEAKLVVIEFNPTIPANVVVIQDEIDDTCFGNSLAALWELALEKDYRLVAVTDWNALFVRNDCCPESVLSGYKPWELKDNCFETYFYHGYNGQIKLSGNDGLVWHGIKFDEARFQVLPKSLQKLPAGQDESYYIAMDEFKNSSGQIK